MKGTIIDFLKLAAEKTELAQELAALAGKYDFEFTDEVSDADLESVAGGTTRAEMEASLWREPQMQTFLGNLNYLQKSVSDQISGVEKA